MNLNRTTYTEQQLDDIIDDADTRSKLGAQGKQLRYRTSKLDPHRGLIMRLSERGKSAGYIKLVLAGGKVKPKVIAGRTTIHDYIKRCESGG